MKEIATEEQNKAASKARDILATYKEAEDLINIGAYEEGSNKEIDLAVNSYLKQGVNEVSQFEVSKSKLINMLD